MKVSMFEIFHDSAQQAETKFFSSEDAISKPWHTL